MCVLDIINSLDIFINYVNKISKNKRKKDIIILLYGIYFSLYLLITLLLIYNNFMKLGIIPIVRMLFISISNFIDFVLGRESFILIPDIKQYHVTFFSEVGLFVKMLFVTMILSITRLSTSKKPSFKKEIIFLTIIILSVIFIYHSYVEILLIMSLSFVLILFFPFGSGVYFDFIQSIKYFLEVIQNYFEDYPIEIKKNKVYFKIFISVFLCICISVGLVNIFNIDLKLGYVISVSLIILIYLNDINKHNKVYYITKKFILWIVFLFINLIYGTSLETDILKYLMLIITIYFSFDRFSLLIKEVDFIIKSESVLYYYENEKDKKKDILEKIVDIKYLNSNVEEKELVIQILLRNRLNMVKELLILIKKYKALGYKKYLQLVKTLEYYNTTNFENIDIIELKEKVNNILTLENKRIICKDIYLEYADILYHLSEYKDCIKYYEDFIFNLSKERLEKLYNSYIETENSIKAKRIKENFLI